MGHRKWKETKRQPGTAGPGNMLGCCLVSLHCLCSILCSHSVLSTNRGSVAADEEDRDGDEYDSQLVLLALLLEEADLRPEDQLEEGGGGGMVVLHV